MSEVVCLVSGDSTDVVAVRGHLVAAGEVSLPNGCGNSRLPATWPGLRPALPALHLREAAAPGIPCVWPFWPG